MTIHETRLAIAVDVALRSRQSASKDTIGAAFAVAHELLLRLGGNDGWGEQVLDAAWALARGATPRGAEVDVLLAALVTAYDAVATVKGPTETRARQRRNG